MVGHENAPSSPGPLALGGAVRCQLRCRAGNAERYRVAKRAAIATGFEAQGIGLRDAVPAVERERGRVEGSSVVDRSPAPTPRLRTDPVGQLVEQREPLIQRVAAGADRDDAVSATGHSSGVEGVASPPGETWLGDPGLGANGGDQGRRPGWRTHSVSVVRAAPAVRVLRRGPAERRPRTGRAAPRRAGSSGGPTSSRSP